MANEQEQRGQSVPIEAAFQQAKLQLGEAVVKEGFLNERVNLLENVLIQALSELHKHDPDKAKELGFVPDGEMPPTMPTLPEIAAAAEAAQLPRRERRAAAKAKPKPKAKAKSRAKHG